MIRYPLNVVSSHSILLVQNLARSVFGSVFARWNYDHSNFLAISLEKFVPSIDKFRDCFLALLKAAMTFWPGSCNGSFRDSDGSFDLFSDSQMWADS
nr:hypothetical protein CFP56_24369 [Quercus suber]